tara:strand:+ start:4145 stop:4552 length:408 start_codon:yes stop_codon:yes gene_type:complete
MKEYTHEIKRGNMQIILAIALGGALGSVGRYILTVATKEYTDLQGLGTLIVNTLGAFLLGMILGMAENRLEISEPIKNGLTIGLLGGFTTFSTFMYDAIYHVEETNWLAAIILITATILLGLIVMISGLFIGRTV